MNQVNQGNSSAPASILPAKRRRGRPRKNEVKPHMEKATATPDSDYLKRNRLQTDHSGHADSALVGQIVSGVLDGSFDAGYLLTVKVGNTNTLLRGVVFEPGLSVPISAANDVAPHVKMFKRTDIPVPVIEPLNQVPFPVSYNELKSNQPTKNHPKTSVVFSSSGLQDDNTHPPKVSSNETNHNLQVVTQANQSDVKTECSETLSEKQLVDVHQALEVAPQGSLSAFEKGKSTDMLSNLPPDGPCQAAGKFDATPLTNKSSDDFKRELPVVGSALPSELKTDKPADALQVSETSCQTTCLLNGAATTKDLTLDLKIEQLEKCSGSGIGNEVQIPIKEAPQVQTLASSSDLKPNLSIDPHIGVVQENKTSNYNCPAYSEIRVPLVSPQGTMPELSHTILKREETVHWPLAAATDTVKEDLQSDTLHKIHSGPAAYQPTLTQQTLEPQISDPTASFQKEFLATEDSASIQTQSKPGVPVTAAGFMDPGKGAHEFGAEAVPEGPSGI